MFVVSSGAFQGGKPVNEIELSGSTLIVRGDLSWELDNIFNRACHDLIEAGDRALAVDMTDVGFVASPFIGKIVKLHTTAAEGARSLKILISPKLEELFEMSGLLGPLDVEVVQR